MRRLCFQFWTRASLGLAALVWGGCSDSTASDGPANQPEQPGTPERVICPQCVVYPGEEQPDSNFGPPPVRTRCSESSRGSAIDEAEARALGFGAILDRMALPIDVPFEWSPIELSGGGSPATGYAPLTRLQGTLRPTAFKRLTASE